MVSQKDDGIIEEVIDVENPSSKGMYYMPHHAVCRKDKTTTKTRVVYDASSKMEGLSLNECLHKGNPVFIDLLATILRFRCHKIGVTADIQQAFLSVGLKEEDRDAVRFLWVKDPKSENLEVIHMRFTRACFGVLSSMSLLDYTIRDHLKKFEEQYPETVEKIRQSLYVDDLDAGDDDAVKAWKLYEETKFIFSEAGMNIRKWRTNDPVLNERFKKAESDPDGKDQDSYSTENLNPKEIAPVKVLGIPWDVADDMMIFSLKPLEEYTYKNRCSRKITKRTLLRALASIFDPLGILSPIVISLKILFQNVCKASVSWDEEIDEMYLKRWEQVIEAVEEFKGVQIPRFYGVLSDESVFLVGFCDASEDAYACCIYAVSQNEDNNSSLILSKTRVSPLKKQTIPRLELLGALILSRAMKRVLEIFDGVMKVEKVFCLTDAEVVLNWIQKKQKVFKQFVQNRVCEIRDNVSIESWYHVSGTENIADLPSRGCIPQRLQEPEMLKNWVVGPDWLKTCVDDWPIKKDIKQMYEDPELKTEMKAKKCLLTTDCAAKCSLQDVIDIKRFNCLDKLVRVTAWCRRFLYNCRRKVEERKNGEIDAQEFQSSELLWVKSSQREMQTESGFEKRCQSLGVYSDENGYLRCRGRIGKANVRFGTKFPILIPTNHYFTELMIRRAHERVYHNGVKETLTEIRSMFWIVKGRQMVKRITKRCYLCKILEGLAYPPPVTCDLPDFRVNPGRVFETTGVDFCGPLYLKQMYKTDGKMYKSYIAINTCATSRMLHLELVPDLTTSAYLRSQRRFTARRGFPSMLVSDNGKTFKGCELKKYNAKHGISWRFNLPKAPWWGGMYERMVRVTKRCLKKAIGAQRLNYEELLTILTEVEAVVNNRPLTYLDEQDVDSILTPSHLFCGRRTLDRTGECAKNSIPNLDAEQVVRRTRLVNTIVEHFWKRWSKEYLLELRQNHKVRNDTRDMNINVGDVVLIHADNVKRNKWKLGKIEEIIVGNDGRIRGAKLKTATGYLKRPLQKMFPLEITESFTEKTNAAVGSRNPQHKDVSFDLEREEKGDKLDVDVVAAGDQDSVDDQLTVAEVSNDAEPVAEGAVSNDAEPVAEDAELNDESINKLIKNNQLKRSKRSAAIDGQLRRRLQMQN